jgi:hypothetical protein
MEPAMNLYAQTHRFQKVAAEVALPEDPNAWPMELLQELYKQAPYISDFSPEVVMDKVHAEQGYGLGHIVLSNKTEMPAGGATQDARQATGIKQVRIPAIVKDGNLQPFDLLLTQDGKIFPLTESRLQQAMFRPQPFDVAGTGPGGSSMVDSLYPPQRSTHGTMGGFGFSKQGSDVPMQLQQVLGLSDEEVAQLRAKALPAPAPGVTALQEALPTVPPERFGKIASAFDAPAVRSAYASRHAITSPALSTLLAYEHKEASAEFNPSVAQVRKEGRSYVLKTASHEAWSPVEERLDRGEVVRRFGAKFAFDVDTAGAVTMVDDESAPERQDEGPEASRPKVVDSFGFYRVRDTAGRELVGYVLANPYSLSGLPLPVYVFSNGSETALQASIAGVSAGHGAELPSAEPAGHGLFYRVLSNGSVEGTVPLDILGSHRAGAGAPVEFQVTSYDGQSGMVALQPDLRAPVAVDGTLALPNDMKWLPLGEAKAVALASTPEEFDGQKTAALRRVGVLVRTFGPDAYGVSGYPIAKVASETILGLNETLFLLGGLGVNLDTAAQKLAEAHLTGGHCPLIVNRFLSPPLAKTAAAAAPPFDLVKEAAYMPDPMSVDTVLSLGFLTPDNIKTFLRHLPQFEKTQTKLCETLLGCRLGLPSVPEEAISRCVQTLESVIAGLKTLAFTPPDTP